MPVTATVKGELIMAMTLHELLEGWVDEAPALRLTGIGLDNREIKPGDAFVAVKGQLVHGLDYARAAVAAGAVAVIHDGLQAVPELGVPAVKVAGLGDQARRTGITVLRGPVRANDHRRCDRHQW